MISSKQQRCTELRHKSLQIAQFFYILVAMPLFLLSTHKQCILSHFLYNRAAMFPKIPEANAMSIAPRRQGIYI
jgi:hypothetical protein